VLLHFSDEFSGISFGFASDNHDVFGVEDDALHAAIKFGSFLVLAMLYLCFVYWVDVLIRAVALCFGFLQK